MGDEDEEVGDEGEGDEGDETKDEGKPKNDGDQNKDQKVSQEKPNEQLVN